VSRTPLPLLDLVTEKLAELLHLMGQAVLESFFIDPDSTFGVSAKSLPLALLAFLTIRLVTSNQILTGTGERRPRASRRQGREDFVRATAIHGF
jgi:K+-sensing histidine kinase KdpD